MNIFIKLSNCYTNLSNFPNVLLKNYEGDFDEFWMTYKRNILLLNAFIRFQKKNTGCQNVNAFVRPCIFSKKIIKFPKRISQKLWKGF